MKELDDRDCDADDMDDCMNGGVQLDPSSISLFSSSSAPQTAAAPKSSGAANSENHFKFLKSNAKAEPTQGGSGPSTSAVNNRKHSDNNDRKRQTLSNYAAGKATEVAKRRNLNERIEKLKTSHGIVFNVPQCEEITLNQLAIFLRRLRKSHDVQSIMSMDMMAKVFQEEKPAEPPASKNGGVMASNPSPLLLQALQQANHHSSNHPAVISVNDLLGSDDDMAHQQKEDEANITESSSDDDDMDAFGRQYYATDDERPTTSGGDDNDTDWNDLEEQMQFYKKRMEVISADMRAVTLTKNITESQRKARLALSSVLDEVKFEAPPQTGNLEEDSQSCARCRAFVERPDRPLCFVNFAERRNRPQSVISQNLRCTVADYAKVDDSIHPFLSLSSAIPMERKVHKYLQVASTLPPEVERRRLKTAELAYRRNHKVCRTFHYTDNMPDLEENATDSPPPISLTIKKKLTRLVREQRDEADDYSPSNTTVDDDDEPTMASSDDDDDVTEDSDYPPCYLRLGKCSMIDQWKTDKNMDFLGLPHYVASGSHSSNGEKYRFLIMPKYDQDLEAIFREKRVFNLKTVLVIAMRIMDTLEYIHSHDYIHSDIKASNIMLGYNESTKRKSTRTRCPIQRYTAPLMNKKYLRKHRRVGHLRPLTIPKYNDDFPDIVGLIEALGATISGSDEKPELANETQSFQADQVYLLDYGLASKIRLSNGHRELSPDQRRAHAGTILFCSRDAHKGIVSRRSDLESLAYNMIYWLTGSLPWMDDINEPEVVERKKNRCFSDTNSFLNICFENTPNFLLKMLNHLSELQCTDTPNYNFFRLLFTNAIKQYGYTNDAKLDLTNTEGWGKCKSKKTKSCKKENNTMFKRPSFLLYNPLKPLSSNIIFKRPKLRKKIRDKLAKNSMMNWSKILIRDPELIIKQGTVRKTPEEERPFSIQDFDLEGLNPTAAMRDVFNRAADKEERPLYGSRGDEVSKVDPIEGYTSEMMKVHQRMIEQRCIQLEVAPVQQKKGRGRPKGSKKFVLKRLSTEARVTLRRDKSAPLRRACRLKG